jgi:hypothetical protein
MRAKQLTVLAERQPRRKFRHRNAAEAWLLLADRIRQAQRRDEGFRKTWNATLTDAADA